MVLMTNKLIEKMKIHFWNSASAELQCSQNLNHQRAPNINYQVSFHPTFYIGD
jgi:hypothetical protein